MVIGWGIRGLVVFKTTAFRSYTGPRFAFVAIPRKPISKNRYCFRPSLTTLLGALVLLGLYDLRLSGVPTVGIVAGALDRFVYGLILHSHNRNASFFFNYFVVDSQFIIVVYHQSWKINSLLNTWKRGASGKTGLRIVLALIHL